jgi:hypothetical protein
MKITTTRPKSIDCLEDAILQLADERRRAMPLLFDNIEQDISQKERFVVGQDNNTFKFLIINRCIKLEINLKSRFHCIVAVNFLNNFCGEIVK